jgi:peroxiredoxin Q/BCP
VDFDLEETECNLRNLHASDIGQNLKPFRSYLHMSFPGFERLFIERIQRQPVTWRPIVVMLFVALSSVVAYATPPGMGQKAPDFTLSTPTGVPIELSKQTGKSSIVLVVLRGFPGYQCPYCQKQVHDFIEHAPEFAAKRTSVLLVYPGPPANLDQHAREFLATQANLPTNVILVTDPDYAMINLYDLRWNAPSETAYPSTFIIDQKGTIKFEKISHSHDDRTVALDILSRIPAK